MNRNKKETGHGHLKQQQHRTRLGYRLDFLNSIFSAGVKMLSSSMLNLDLFRFLTKNIRIRFYLMSNVIKLVMQSKISETVISNYF